MIPVDLSQFIVVFMLMGVCLVVFLWTLSLWRDSMRDARRRRIAIQCRICNCTYQLQAPPNRRVGQDSPTSICPACGSRNQRGALGPI
jgi:hypothetical protein